MFGIDKTQPIIDFSSFEPSQITDALLYGATMLLIGMITIFAVLCLLWGCMTLFKIVFHDMLGNKKPGTSTGPKTPAPVAPSVSRKESDEVVAAIAAAIAMAESEGGGIKFKVVSFRRK